MPSVMKATEDHRHEATTVSPQSGSQFPGGNLVEGDSIAPIDIYTDGSYLGKGKTDEQRWSKLREHLSA